MREIEPIGQAKPMIWLLAGGLTLIYLLFWPFSIRLDARLTPTSGRAELTAASFVRLRLEGDFLQPPYFSLYRLDGQGRRRPLGGGRRRRSGFSPVIWDRHLYVTLHVGVEGDGALAVQALGIVHSLLETAGNGCCSSVAVRSAACFDKNICALRLSGIGRFVLAQNILEYLKGKNRHAKR